MVQRTSTKTLNLLVFILPTHRELLCRHTNLSLNISINFPQGAHIYSYKEIAS